MHRHQHRHLGRALKRERARESVGGVVKADRQLCIQTCRTKKKFKSTPAIIPAWCLYCTWLVESPIHSSDISPLTTHSRAQPLELPSANIRRLSAASVAHVSRRPTLPCAPPTSSASHPPSPFLPSSAFRRPFLALYHSTPL